MLIDSPLCSALIHEVGELFINTWGKRTSEELKSEAIILGGIKLISEDSSNHRGTNCPDGAGDPDPLITNIVFGAETCFAGQRMPFALRWW